MEVEELLGSKGRIKILKVLFRDGHANITRIVKETGLHHRLVVKHMEELKRMGIVEERRYGRMRIYYVNLSDPKVGALREALKALGLL